MPAETRELAGSVVAITGATSGVGRAVAQLLAAAGARLALTGRREHRLQELADSLGPDHVTWVAGDIAEPATSAALVRAAVERFGRLDSIVVSAGMGAYGGILDRSDDLLATMLRTNIDGTVWAVRAAVPALLSGGGDIVIIASVAGLRGDGNEAVYAATKFAQVGLAGALDRELRTSGIRVTAMCPAAIDTEFALGTGRTPGDPWLSEVLTAEDVAGAVLTVLRQPRRLRTTQWTMWAMTQGA
ncbi:MAG: SDR family NAD(P)-dependent oxidoreductase [Actinomycetales bacterium]|nr:SDR family NAD(P)-dependent oxidoreductase [Actinomycetales bacterium]